MEILEKSLGFIIRFFWIEDLGIYIKALRRIELFWGVV
jgi:hypothetical protein